MLLNELSVGQPATVSGFSDAGMRHHTRYLSLGLIPGNKIRVLRVAPLGCPLQIKVGSTMLSIRKTEALEVLVEVSV
ncbi:FeoA family protein [Reinekea sp. G2M2-21]|uniref:FeoA family protein n=1 Tax=Reinekea sp. G2M2-21 TaxID=2788942 RepID=UPI0018AACE7A|nr:FeoA family protein [Reinekea sp. G2M2-21]